MEPGQSSVAQPRLCVPLFPAACMAQVLLKGDDRLVDVISQYASDSRADLLVTGSQNLCVDGECRILAALQQQ